LPEKLPQHGKDHLRKGMRKGKKKKRTAAIRRDEAETRSRKARQQTTGNGRVPKTKNLLMWA